MSENLAVGLESFGDPDVLHLVERAVPEPGPGEALVRVHAATVNPTDILLRSGNQAARLKGFTPPYTPGMELAGVVVGVYPDQPGGHHIAVGDRVAGVVPPWRATGGAQSRFVVVDTQSLVRIPESIDDVAAATLPMNGLTALMALELLELKAGDSILVTGGPGALGGYILSIARHRGFVAFADGRDDDRRLLADLGAETVVPRGQAMLDALAALAPKGVDGIVDAARLAAAASPALRTGGVFVQVRSEAPPVEEGRIRTRNVSVATQLVNTTKLEEVMRLAEAGVIRPRVAQVLQPAQAAEAHRRIEHGGMRGRLVLDFSC